MVVAETADGLQRMLDTAFADSWRNRYQFSADKCECVVFGAEADVVAAQGEVMPPFFINGEPIRRATSFRYLGMQLAEAVSAGVHVDMPPLRLAEINEQLQSNGHRMNLLRVASRDPRLTPVDSWLIYFGHVMGLYDFGSSFMARGVPESAAKVQLEAAKVIMGLPPTEYSFEKAALLGDLGLRSPDVIFTHSALRLLARIHAVSEDAQLARLWRHYRVVVEEHGSPDGNWCSWVRAALANVGYDADERYERGWPAVEGRDGLRDVAATTLEANEDIRRRVRVWQDAVWRAAVAGRSALNPLYARLHTRVELAEYLREGSHRSRRCIMRLRSEMIPAAIVGGVHHGSLVPSGSVSIVSSASARIRRICWHDVQCMRCSANGLSLRCVRRCPVPCFVGQAASRRGQSGGSLCGLTVRLQGGAYR